MRKTCIRVVVLLLCMAMTVGLLPVMASAENDGVAINKTNFPDPVFRLYVSEKFDDDGDGYLSESEIGADYDEEWDEYNNTYSMELFDSNISSLKGIEFFTGLTSLSCGRNKLTSLDLSHNILLESLYCYDNQLTSLDLTKNTELYFLNCSGNNLSTLDVSKNTNLTELYCYDNKLTSLNISNNTALRELDCYGNPIGKLDIRNNTKLLQAATLGIKEYRSYNSPNMSYRLNALDWYLTISSTTRLQIGDVAPPAVTTQPKNVDTGAGKKVTLSVAASGSGLQYQWYANSPDTNGYWKAVKNATDSSLTVTVKENWYEASYYCEITNSGGSVCTKEAVISRLYKPYIYSQPTNKTVKAGKTVAFKVKAGGEKLKYQWYYQKPKTNKWVKITKNGTSATLKITAKKKLNGYKYRCKVYNAAGSVNSKAVKLTVK